MAGEEYITFNPPDNIEDMVENGSELSDSEEEAHHTFYAKLSVC